jgi:hypothetical protein
MRRSFHRLFLSCARFFRVHKNSQPRIAIGMSHLGTTKICAALRHDSIVNDQIKLARDFIRAQMFYVACIAAYFWRMTSAAIKAKLRRFEATPVAKAGA